MSTLPTDEEKNTPFDDATHWAGNMKEDKEDEDTKEKQSTEKDN